MVWHPLGLREANLEVNREKREQYRDRERRPHRERSQGCKNSDTNREQEIGRSNVVKKVKESLSWQSPGGENNAPGTGPGSQRSLSGQREKVKKRGKNKRPG